MLTEVLESLELPGGEVVMESAESQVNQVFQAELERMDPEVRVVILVTLVNLVHLVALDLQAAKDRVVIPVPLEAEVVQVLQVRKDYQEWQASLVPLGPRVRLVPRAPEELPELDFPESLDHRELLERLELLDKSELMDQQALSVLLVYRD